MKYPEKGKWRFFLFERRKAKIPQKVIKVRATLTLKDYKINHNNVLNDSLSESDMVNIYRIHLIFFYKFQLPVANSTTRFEMRLHHSKTYHLY